MKRRRSRVIDQKDKVTESCYQVYTMPAVGGVRRTRVFGLQKGTDGARVLRSGRKVWTDDKIKNQRPDDEELSKNSLSTVSFEHEKENGWSKCVSLKNDPFPSRSLKETKNCRELRRFFSVVYVRKRKRDKLLTARTDCSPHNSHKKSKPSEEDPCISIVSDDFSNVIGIESLILPILVYMKEEAMNLHCLSSYLYSEPQCSIYRSKGILFFRDYPVNKPGFCKLFGSLNSTPSLTLDFSCLPSFFTSQHLDLLFQPKILLLLPSYNFEKLPQDTDSCKIKIPHPSIRASNIYGRSSQFRIGRKTRSSLKQRRRRNNSLALQSSKSSTNYTNTRSRSEERKALPLKPKASAESSTFTTNLLVTESIRGYRIPAATVSIEHSTTGEWMLVAKKDDTILYSMIPHQSMKPCSINSGTQDFVWAIEEACKLEFPDRQQWLTFKQLFKECADHNTPSPSTSRFIPTPKVTEVFDYFQESGVFERPISYISFPSEEVERALAKNAVYEMDSDDDTWLRNNEKSFSEQEFEGLIDAFEKAAYCNEEKLNDENDAVCLCGQMVEKEVVECVYRYWVSKRKQRKSALLRVFQEPTSKKAPLIPKPTLRKKRSSFKRQPSLVGRVNDSELLKAIAAQRNAAEERNAFTKLGQAKESAKKVVDYAISKRLEAQLFMENADLAVYRAVMTLKISEAANCSYVAYPSDDT